MIGNPLGLGPGGSFFLVMDLFAINSSRGIVKQKTRRARWKEV